MAGIVLSLVEYKIWPYDSISNGERLGVHIGETSIFLNLDECVTLKGILDTYMQERYNTIPAYDPSKPWVSQES